MPGKNLIYKQMRKLLRVNGCDCNSQTNHFYESIYKADYCGMPLSYYMQLRDGVHSNPLPFMPWDFQRL